MRKVIEEIEYQSLLNLMDTQIAIKFVKDTFQKEMVKSLNLLRVTAPMFVFKQSGINDHLTGREEPVSFSVNGYEDDIEIVQSLAKWKRIALKEYGFEVETGLYTDMNAIRKDEIVDFIHSLYVDQWDWEKVIDKIEHIIEIANHGKINKIMSLACFNKSPVFKKLLTFNK